MSLEEALRGKKVLVTGAGKGLGRALVERLHSYGAIVYALSKTSENLRTLEKEFPGVKTICLDLGDWESTRNALMELEPMDCLINNAAVLLVRSIMDTTSEEFDRVYNVNTKGTMNTIQVIAKKMIEAGKPGSIVNVSTIGATRAFTVSATYCASKAAMEHMSRCLALELGPHKIRVNIVQPALMQTVMCKELLDGFPTIPGNEELDGQLLVDVLKSRTPTQVPMMPLDQMVNTILFMLSDLAPQITGQTLTVDGGFMVT